MELALIGFGWTVGVFTGIGICAWWDDICTLAVRIAAARRQ
jgi:hypothetical protein